MRIPNIQPPQLSCLTRRIDGTKWLNGKLAGHKSVTFSHSEPIELSSGSFDIVGLIYSLNYRPDLEKRRAAIREAQKLLAPGGKVIAIARACDSGIELAERMVRTGVHPSKLGVSNLGNKEIACLRPKEAVFLSSNAILRLDEAMEPKEQQIRIHEFARRVRKSPVEPDIRGEYPEQFATKLFDVGLVWTK